MKKRRRADHRASTHAVTSRDGFSVAWCGQAERVTAFCLVFFRGTRDAILVGAMRDYDEEDPKKPQPVRIRRKGDCPQEAAEHGSRQVNRDDDRDRHRHV
jgi:hypothetical protein